MSGSFLAAGNFVSSTKDSNPAAGNSTTWTTLSWTATIPANTTLAFQAAGSNNSASPFNFVGPDGTANTYFTLSGASLSQFYGLRYLRYKAYFTTTDNTQTPTLNDVTVSYNLSPTAANGSIFGQVIATSGRGISNVVITLQFQDGQLRYIRTNPFGFYRINDLPVGQTYVLSAASKQYKFQSRAVSLIDDLSEINFVADSPKE